MFSKIFGGFKWILATAAVVGGAIYSEHPVTQALLWISSAFAGTGTIIAIVPNTWLRPVGYWIGSYISKHGRNRLGILHWEQIEDGLQSGSLRTAVVAILSGVFEGLDSDD
ncbi:hypothetical protein LCGC14_2620550 [marine sediment metagenome]|uniref:Uncharacterized protein n=1 Tax=marine sediment metagenome TaxID=412755 RepID=A0A0F9A3F2_9ZZZZ